MFLVLWLGCPVVFSMECSHPANILCRGKYFLRKVLGVGWQIRIGPCNIAIDIKIPYGQAELIFMIRYIRWFIWLNRISHYFLFKSLEDEEVLTFLWRPQSAKPGYKGYWGQASSDDINEQSLPGKNAHRKQIKIMKPDLTTHDFARILPKKIHQDK